MNVGETEYMPHTFFSVTSDNDTYPQDMENEFETVLNKNKPPSQIHDHILSVIRKLEKNKVRV